MWVWPCPKVISWKSRHFAGSSVKPCDLNSITRWVAVTFRMPLFQKPMLVRFSVRLCFLVWGECIMVLCVRPFESWRWHVGRWWGCHHWVIKLRENVWCPGNYCWTSAKYGLPPMAGAVRHGSDGLFALDMVRGDLKSVPISSPQQGSQADERAWSRCSRNQKPLAGRDRGEPVCSRITAWVRVWQETGAPKNQSDSFTYCRGKWGMTGRGSDHGVEPGSVGQSLTSRSAL